MFLDNAALLPTRLILLAAILIGFANPLRPQSTTATVISLGVTPQMYGVVQAGDGNFYAPSPPFFGACLDNPNFICAFIYQIAPSGTATPIYSFQREANTGSIGVANADGIWPTALIVGTDGNLYGTCRWGGPGGGGTIFEIALDGTNKFTLLKSFSYATNAQEKGASPTSLMQGKDGTFYFTNGIGVYQLTQAGAVNTIYEFPFDPNTSLYAMGSGSTSLVQGSDGNLYMPMSVGQQTASGTGQQGAIGQLTLGGVLTILHNLAADGHEGEVPGGPLVQGPDGAFYGVTRGSAVSPTAGVDFKVSSDQSFQVLHGFTGGADGNNPATALLLGSDGNFYGTTPDGGNVGACSPDGCGTAYQLTPAGGFTTIHTFAGGIPSIQNPLVDGASPTAPLVQSDGGFFYGTQAGGTGSPPVFFEMALNPSVSAPIELSLSPAQVGVNSTATLTWKVHNAYSQTAQNCGAVLQGGSGGGNWSGVQPVTLTNGVYGGTTTIKPTQAGTYTYGLVCGGNEAGFVTETVSGALTIATQSLPAGTVGKTYPADSAIEVTGGTTPYTWSATMPQGLTLDPDTGEVSGEPLQYGNYSIAVTVTDSATPANQVTATVTMSVVSGMTVDTGSFPKATVNVNYYQGLYATGGLEPYTWTVVNGTLPAGLSIDPTGGISGTPTEVGKFAVTIQVADNESTPAIETFARTINIVPTVQIAAVEFTQVIQLYQTLEDLQASLTADNEPPVPIVSYKPAVMRVYFTTVKDATTVTLTATGAAAQQMTLTLPPDCAPTDARRHNNLCPSMDIYFIPQSGAWSTTLTLTDDEGNQLEQETLGVTSRDAVGISYKAVSVCTVPNQPSSCQDPTGLLSILDVSEKLLPTSSVVPTITTQRVYSSLVPWTTTGIWEDYTTGLIDNLYLPSDLLSDNSNQERTDYIGFYSHSIDTTGEAELAGHGVLLPDVTVRLGVTNTPFTLAHEAGHTLNLDHTNLVDPKATEGVPPGCWQVAPSSNPYWPYSDNKVQSSAGPEIGFDVAAGTIVDGTNNFDLMAYCVPRWISPLNYARALLFANPGPQAGPFLKGSRPEDLRLPETKARPEITLAPGSYMNISGFIFDAVVALDPIFTENMIGTSDPGTGTYSIQEQDAGGTTLFTRYFTPTNNATETVGTDHESFPHVSEYIPAMAGAAAIVILDPNGNTLNYVALGGDAPVVTITSPVAGFVGTGQQVVSWTISSSSATSFMSRIYYSIDGGTTWLPIEETPGTSETLDFSTLPGAAAALVRIDASDGINTGSATSVPFNVPKKVPTAIVITSPVTGAVQPASKPVYLSGAAYDPDDGVLTGSALQWSDSVLGSLGTGSPLSVNLQAGSHTITLTATDSDGNVLTATTQIILGGSAPVVNLTSTQAAGNNCFNATVGASPGSQGANLSIVNYSLTGGSSYSSIPLNSLPFTFPVSGTGTVIVVALAQDASGQVAAQSLEINVGAGCNANPAQITPSVTVTPSSSGITIAQAINVTVAVSGGAGNPIPTGSVTLSSGSYTSVATTLSSGSVTINIPAGSLVTGTDTVTATYTPDSNSASSYNSAMGTNTVTVTAAPAPGFALTNNGPITFEASAATGNTATISVTPSNGFTGAVNLTCALTTIPTGATSPATCAVTPSVTITGATAQNATLTVTTTATTTAGAYAVTVAGSSGAITMPTTVGVTVTAYVPPPTFSLSNNGPITFEANATTGNTAAITVAPANGFIGTVNLTCVVTTAPANATSPASCAVTTPVSITGAASQNATLTVTSTTTTTAGAYAVTVTGTSGAVMMPTTVTANVSAYVAPSFTLSNGGAITISSPGATSGNTTSITVMPSGGFVGNVTLSAAIATGPSGATDPPTFSFGATSPVNITGASSGTGTLTVSTTAATTGALVRPNSRGTPWYAVGGTALACLLFFGIPARRRRWRMMLGVFTLFALLTGGLVSCGGKSSGGGGGGGGNSGTTTGTYTITVTGASGSIMQTTTVTLTVN